MSVFQSADYDPIFVIEANFDGPPGPFWAQMEATFGSEPSADAALLQAPGRRATGRSTTPSPKPFSRYPLAPTSSSRTLRPSVFHQGNRGLERDRILREGELFLATRNALAQANPTAPNPYRGMTAEEIHSKLRAALLPQFPWLATPAPARISWAERIGDLARLLGFVFVVLFCLSIPGMALAPVMPAWRFLILSALLRGWWRSAVAHAGAA